MLRKKESCKLKIFPKWFRFSPKLPLILSFMSPILRERLLPSLLQAQWDSSLEQCRVWKMVHFGVGFMECF